MEQTNDKPDFNQLASTFAITSRSVVASGGEQSAAIVIENGLIRDVVESSKVPAGIPVEDFGDLVISPGLVDAHVHVNEPGRTEWEGFASATAAAAAGGVTTIIDMPLNSSPVTTTAAALKAKRAAAEGQCLVNVGFYGGRIPGNDSDLLALADHGVLGIKAFLCDSGLAEFPASGERELRAALAILKPRGLPVLVHAELVGQRLAPDFSNHRCYAQYADSRPPEFETAAIELLIRLCREFNSPIHIVHLATADALPMIEAAKNEGLPLTVETCPHYLFFSDREIEDGQTSFKCAPPIRDDENRIKLCSAVRSGLIETIGSDHSPCSPDLKMMASGDFSKAWGGIAGLQLTLPVCWTVGQEHGWTKSLLAKRLSQRPAEIFGLGNRKGKIEAGFDADLVVWDPAAEFDVKSNDLFHRHNVTPYESRRLKGFVNRTYVGGQIVYDAGKLSRLKAVGRLLSSRTFVSDCLARFLNGQTEKQLPLALGKCCASQAWIAGMMSAGEFENDDDALSRAEKTWGALDEIDWLEAFSAHPQIGNVETLREQYANTKVIARGEQSGIDSADESTLRRLANVNVQYCGKFGFIFIVCATGKSANEMLGILERRLKNDRPTELKNAAAEQLKITKIRLRSLIA